MNLGSTAGVCYALGGQKLLRRNKYLAGENQLLRAHLPARLRELHCAIGQGCWFSVGPAMLSRDNGRMLAGLMPRDRVLTESDGPFAHIDVQPVTRWQVDSAVRVLSNIRSEAPLQVTRLTRISAG